MTAYYRQSIDDALDSSVGDKGLSHASLDRRWLKELRPRARQVAPLARQQRAAALQAAQAPRRSRELKPHAERLAKFEHVVVMGSGGSSLSGKTLVALKDQGFGPQKGRPKLWFMDNVDPATFEALKAQLPLDRTAVIAISKSGGTPETLAAFLALATSVPAANVLAVTEATDNPLRRLATKLGSPILDHDPKVGGRFASLSLVGMLPAMIAGLDCVAIREGAASVLDPALAAKDASALAPAQGAALSVGLAREKGINITVLMPYVDRFNTFAYWYRQIWAERASASRASAPRPPWRWAPSTSTARCSSISAGRRTSSSPS